MKMPTNIRLTKVEQEGIRQKAIEINKLLVKRGLEPMKDSELAHIILEKAIDHVHLNDRGEVVIERS